MKRGLLAVLAAVAAEIALALLAAEFGSAVSSFFYFVPPCLILAGFVWGAVRPRLYADGPAGPHTGCLAGLLVPAFLLFGLVWMGSAFLVWTSEGQIDRSENVYDPAKTWKGQWTVEPFVPAGARNFRCEGRCGFGGTVRFSCEVSKQDFLAHAASNHVELRRDDASFNANPATAGSRRFDGTDPSLWLDIPEESFPEHFWFHGWVNHNNGGRAVVYDIDRGILYGFWSHR